MLGIPCFTAGHAMIDALQTAIEQSPSASLEARVDTGIVTAGSLKVSAAHPAPRCAMDFSPASGTRPRCSSPTSTTFARSRLDSHM